MSCLVCCDCCHNRNDGIRVWVACGDNGRQGRLQRPSAEPAAEKADAEGGGAAGKGDAGDRHQGGPDENEGGVRVKFGVG